MPAWPGGPCPGCGDDMPANLVHCQKCRALLNPELESDTVEIPAFLPLQEISAMVEVEPAGFYINCPACTRELKIASKYAGRKVQCRHCTKPFRFRPQKTDESHVGFYCKCPHCTEQLRVAIKYLGQKVACRQCQGHLHLLKPH